MTKLTREQKKSFRLLLNALKDAMCFCEDVADVLRDLEVGEEDGIDTYAIDADACSELDLHIGLAIGKCEKMMEALDIEELTNGKRW